MVAADHHGGHAVIADAGQRPLGDPERAVGGPGVVEHVAQPDHQVGVLGQGQVDGGLERPLEVQLALVDPGLGRERVVGPAQMGVADGSHSHAPANQSGGTNTKDVVYPRGMRSVAGTSAARGVPLRPGRATPAPAVAVAPRSPSLAAASGWAGAPRRPGGSPPWARPVSVLAWLVRPRPDPERWLRGAAGEVATAAAARPAPVPALGRAARPAASRAAGPTSTTW